LLPVGATVQKVEFWPWLANSRVEPDVRVDFRFPDGNCNSVFIETKHKSGLSGAGKRLLQLEIETLDPDVVIFVAGHTWMHWFWEKDMPNRLDVDWEPDVGEWWNQPIHRIGHKKRQNGQARLFVATARLELRGGDAALARRVEPALTELLQRWSVEHPIRSN
jgi:hypothetical protein